jgi:hypothetical protein
LLRGELTTSNNKSVTNNIVDLLNKELVGLVAATGLGSNFKICYAPQENSVLDGEVKDNTIWIYCHSKEKAIQTVRHEFVDWLIVEAIKPYEQLVNVQRAAINAIFRHMQEQSYNRKELVVEALLKLIQTEGGGQS